MLTLQDEMDAAFALCKMQAATEGAFPDELTKHWFDAAWDICAVAVDLVYPAQEIVEPIRLDHLGRFHLSHKPTSDVRIYDGYTLLTILPPSLERSHCDPPLCCSCNLSAHYSIGSNFPCSGISPRFVQGVARVFAYLVANRGDIELDDAILHKSGAIRFLEPDMTFVA